MREISDIGSVVMDEIALEGLDGITLEGLFVRLKERPEFSTAVNEAYKQYIWMIICNFSEVDMFELPEPRKPLVIFNRYDYVDPELGMVLEPEILPEEIYPYAPVDEKDTGTRGSCIFYKERKSVYEVASKLSLQEVLERWGTKLVIVASQKMRNLALMGPSVDPELELNILQYCILERVGRSRHLGEVTHGPVSLQITGEDPKALFYHRKFLMKHGLITKQIHHQKSGSQNCSGSLLHLPRFFVERWPKILYLTKRVIEILRGCKNYLADYDEIRKKLGLTNSLKKLFQTCYFQRFVRTDLRLPYRHLYPDAKESEWRSMNSMKEKMIRVIQLIDPNAEVDVFCAKDEEFDMDYEEHNEATSSREEFSLTLNRSFLSQAYQCVEGAGVNGYSQMQLVQKMGLTKLCARTVSRNLLKRGVASTFMNDVGRQRVSRFRARKWDQQCTRIQTIERDLQHMRAELLSKAMGAGHDIPGSSIRSNIPLTSNNQNSKKRPADVSVDDLKAETEVTQNVKRGPDSTLSGGPPTKILRSENLQTGDLTSSSNEEQENTNIPAVAMFAASPLYSSITKFQTKEELRKYFQHQSKDGPVMTYRIFKRINMILEYVKIHKVVDDHSKFLKLINEEEEREGLNMKIDKKSLLRLLVRLKENGQLKLHSYILTDGIKVKSMIFICDKNVSLDHPAIVSAIEQAKMKLFIVNRESIHLAVANSTAKGTQSHKPLSKKQKMTFVYDKKIGRKYGFCPKFIRMRTLHQFLFYLIYGYEGDPNLDQNTVIPFLESKDVTVDDTLRSELTQVYVLDVHWKMFIPPLPPPHSGGPKGWSIMCDILLRLPLSIFVRVFNVCYVVTGLNEYLKHPVRRHFLVRQLPVPMQNGLMAFRKYIFSIHEVVQRLCYIGLVQFGPQRLKEKDQVLIYLNQKTSLLDTVNSKPGYHQISEEDYQEVKYEFKTMQDVESYWYNLWNICINTQLGGRMCVQGKDIVLEHLSFKPQMQEALQPVRPSRAPGRDTGTVPGDRRGAAGLDSAIFAHLKRNWYWSNVSSKSEDVTPKKVDRRRYRLMNIQAAPVVFNKSTIIVKRSINYLQKGRFSALRTERRSHAIPPGAEVLPKKGQKKQNVVRRIEARKTRTLRKPFYDDIDLKALQMMSKLRVEWSAEEDTLLLLCKVASMYLCPNPRQQTIALSSIRDILHSSIPEAQNKTSKACQRRILYMLKNLATSNNLGMHLEELKQDEGVCERFGKPEDNVRGSHECIEEYEARIHEKFKLLVGELQERSSRMVTASGTYCSTIPDTSEDFWKLFDVVEPKTVIKCKGAFQDVKNVVDVHCSIVNTIIHSSLCSSTDKTSFAYQLFRVYQQYPDSLLRAAMAKLRQDQMVSLKKSYARYKQKGNYLPLSSSPYQLSVTYLQLIQTKYQYDVFHEAYLMLKDLLAWTDLKSGMPVTGANGGGAAAMVELLCKKGISLMAEIPEQVIILDPWISEKDQTYTRIVQRFKDILQTYKTGRDSTTSALFRVSLGMERQQRNNVTKGNHLSLGDDCGDEQHAKCTSMHSDQIGNKQNFLKSSEKDSQVHVKDMNIKLQNLVSEVQDSSCTTDNHLVLNDTAPKHLEMEQASNIEGSESLPLQKHLETKCAEEVDSSRNHSSSCSQENHDLQKITYHAPPEESTAPVVMESLLSEEVLTSNNSEISVEKHMSQQELKSDTLNSEHVKIDSIVEVDSIAKSNDAENSKENKKLGNIDYLPRVEKKQIRKWGRLDFDWTPDKEWDSDTDTSDRVIEESDETDGPDDERIRGDYINIEGETDDGDGTTPSNQQTLVARAATRIALFMMKEEMDDSSQMKSNQHAHDFFVVNSCSVFCHVMENNPVISESNVLKADVSTSNESTKIVGKKALLCLTHEKISEVLNHIKSKAIVDIQVPTEEEIFEGVPADHCLLMKAIMKYVESKKRLGATISQIRTFYKSMECGEIKLASIISLLVQKRVLMQTGVTFSRYVHLRHIWPWLAHTFKFLRLEREKIIPSDSKIISCSEEIDCSKSKDIREQGGDENTVSLMEKSSETVLEESDVVKAQSVSVSSCFQSNENINCLNDDKESPNQSPHLDDKKSAQKENSAHKSSPTIKVNVEDNIEKNNESLDKVGKEKEQEEQEEREIDGPSRKRVSSRKSKHSTGLHPLGTIVDSKDMKKVAQSLAFSERDQIHILIRPWIRINGTVNRRVLDRLLGAILGHAMYQPGQTIHSFGIRFQPALQPAHTRELIEILQNLGCIKLLVPQRKQKVTLFSKPKPVVLVDADGTEDDEEIIVEPMADAICRLGEFIGEKSYNQDFMAAQEQMFSGQSSMPSSRKKRYTRDLLVDDPTRSELLQSCPENNDDCLMDIT